MAYSPQAIANYFLELAEKHGSPLSPMKLQKLVYFAVGWNLAINDQPLINEQVECWQYGPVIPTLFEDFKAFGSGPIKCRAVKRKNTRKMTPSVRKTDSDVIDVLDMVWRAYGRHGPIKLSNMTHLPGTPWRQVFDAHNGKPPRGTDIPIETIREHFTSLIGSVGAK